MSGSADLLATMATLGWTGFVVFLRTAALTALLPAFGERTVPVRVKVMLSFSFTMIVAPAAPVSHTAPGFPDLLLYVWVEVLVGVALGISLRLFVIALQTAGSIAAQSTSLAQVTGGLAEPTPAMGYLLVLAGLALSVTLGLHIKAAQYLIASYEVFPIGQLPSPSELAEWGVSRVAAMFRLAFSLAAPFAVAALIYNLTLGVINRAMPQLMVALVGAPFTTFGGLVLLTLAAPTMLQHWHELLNSTLSVPASGGP